MFKVNARRLAVLAIAGLGFLGAALAIHPHASAAASRANAGDANQPVIRFVKNPEVAPAIQGLDILGKPISKDNLAGKVVLVNFWATWCPPCREEIPELLRLKKEFKDRMEVVGISEDDDPPASVLKFARQNAMTYPIVMATPELIESYGGVPALPTSFLVDTQGRVVQKHSGLYPMESYELEIRSLLGMPTRCARRDVRRYRASLPEKCRECDGIARREFQGADPRPKEAGPSPAELGKLHVRLQFDAFAVPGE